MTDGELKEVDMEKSELVESSGGGEGEKRERRGRWVVACYMCGLIAVGSAVYFFALVFIQPSNFPIFRDSEVVYVLLGISSLITGGVIAPLAGGLTLLLSLPACWQAKRVSGLPLRHRSIRSILEMGGVGLILVLLHLPASLQLTQEPSCCYLCSGNMKQWGFVFKVFASENPAGYYPELSPEAGRLMCWREDKCAGMSLYPDCLYDPTLFICVRDKDYLDGVYGDLEDPEILFNDRWFMYLGYVVRNERELEAFAEAYWERVGMGKRFDEDLKVAPGEGNCGTDTLYRFREGIERVLMNAPDRDPAASVALSEIPVMIERVGNNHEPKGGHVLYMDGHVDYVPYPGKWPMTETTVTILRALAGEDQNSPPDTWWRLVRWVKTRARGGF